MSIIYIIIIIMLAYLIFARKLYYSNFVIKGNSYVNARKLMIVAHPDDELIFGGRELLTDCWKVVCVTNGTARSKNVFSFFEEADTRRKEFVSVMNALNCEYEILDYEDNGYNSNWDDTSIRHKLHQIITERPYQMVLTHNLNGEYGHIQHKKLSQLVHQLNPPNLYVFAIGYKPNPYANVVRDLLYTYYLSQRNIIKLHDKYIQYQSICPA